MKATIMSFGSELLQGFLTDTNATFLAQELSVLGVETVGVAQIGDDLYHVTRALRRALDDSELIITTGGIGPTADDLTREAIAEVCGEQPYVDPVVLGAVRDFFHRRGSEMPERNAKQAWIIPSAEILPNPNGTAPGWFVRRQGKLIVAMPGVPREMMPMWTLQAVPRLLPSLPEQKIVVQTLKTIGIGESAAEDSLREIIERGNPTVSTYAKNDGVHIRIVAASQRPAEAARAAQQAEDEIRAALGRHVYGYLDDPLPRAVLSPLLKTGSTLALWEAGTGGRVVNLLTSDEVVAPVIHEARVTTLNIARGQFGVHADVLAISREMAQTMSETAGATYALGIAVELADADDMGRHDARIGVSIMTPYGLSENEYKVAAAPREVQRRSSLMAAEFLRLSIPAARASHLF